MRTHVINGTLIQNEAGIRRGLRNLSIETDTGKRIIVKNLSGYNSGAAVNEPVTLFIIKDGWDWVTLGFKDADNSKYRKTLHTILTPQWKEDLYYYKRYFSKMITFLIFSIFIIPIPFFIYYAYRCFSFPYFRNKLIEEAKRAGLSVDDSDYSILK